MQDHDLERMTEHVAYEIKMLQGTAVLLRMGVIGTGALQNALLESALVHLRLVDEFLSLPKGNRADDVVAKDFLPTWEPKQVLTESAREDINKRVHHLTTRRIGQQRLWPLDLCHDAVRVCIDFLVQLESDEPQRAAWFTRHGVRWIELSEAPAGVHEVGW
jgi:hypothetical protein